MKKKAIEKNKNVFPTTEVMSPSGMTDGSYGAGEGNGVLGGGMSDLQVSDLLAFVHSGKSKLSKTKRDDSGSTTTYRLGCTWLLRKYHNRRSHLDGPRHNQGFRYTLHTANSRDSPL